MKLRQCWYTYFTIDSITTSNTNDHMMKIVLIAKSYFHYHRNKHIAKGCLKLNKRDNGISSLGATDRIITLQPLSCSLLAYTHTYTQQPADQRGCGVDSVVKVKLR